MTKGEEYSKDNYLLGIEESVELATERIKDAYSFSSNLGLGKLYAGEEVYEWWLSK